MPTFKRLTAAAAVAASLAVAGTAPASASEGNLDGVYCGGEISVPDCVNWTFDTTQKTIEDTRWRYNNQVQPVLNHAACIVFGILTDDDCPEDTVPQL